MSPTKGVLHSEPSAKAVSGPNTAANNQFPPRLPNVRSGVNQINSAQHVAAAGQQNGCNFQSRVPVIVGEITFRGSLPVDGLISGQLSANGGSLTVSQRSRHVAGNSVAELNGEISFRNMLRINGHIAGKVVSQQGTLIIDASAKVDADIEVAVALINGTVTGDVSGHERIELGSQAIIKGNISTRSLTIKPGAIFHGDCCMLKDDERLQTKWKRGL